MFQLKTFQPTITVKLKTPPTEEKPQKRNISPGAPQAAARPQSMHNVAVTNLNDYQKPTPPKPKPATEDSSHNTDVEILQSEIESPSLVSFNQLAKRVEVLEALVEKQAEALENLHSRLQLECEMRIMLQEDLDKRMAQCVLQVWLFIAMFLL